MNLCQKFYQKVLSRFPFFRKNRKVQNTPKWLLSTPQNNEKLCNFSNFVHHNAMPFRFEPLRT